MQEEGQEEEGLFWPAPGGVVTPPVLICRDLERPVGGWHPSSPGGGVPGL